jgi:AAA+ ATPase superfamily predicted ATPase
MLDKRIVKSVDELVTLIEANKKLLNNINGRYHILDNKRIMNTYIGVINDMIKDRSIFYYK